MRNYDIIIIGAGIVGLSTALQLLQRDKTLKIAILEKEAQVSLHQSGHNSGVIHAGVYYKPGSLKAKFCVEGCRSLKEFCQEHAIPFHGIGKIIAAIKPHELPWMHDLAERCQKNGLSVTLLTQDEARRLQPGLECLAAFFVKETGIVDFKQVSRKMAELFQYLGGEIYFNERVTHLSESAHGVTLKTQQHRYQSNYLVSCAGLYADRLVKRQGFQPDFKIIPFRGEYYRLSSSYDSYFKHTIYPVPDPRLPFLGVHFTPQIAGFTTIGPNAVLALSREAYRWRDMSVRDSFESLAFLPLWKMIYKNFSATWHEIRGSLSKEFYLQQVQAYFPGIKKMDLQHYPAGVRAQAIDKQGQLINDFLFKQTERTLHVCNAPSPAATSSLPIGKYIIERLLCDAKVLPPPEGEGA